MATLNRIKTGHGSNNLPNLKLDDENWKVRLIEEEFMKHMWDVEGI
jgi:adenine-specific DNA-methyltransferase